MVWHGWHNGNEKRKKKKKKKEKKRIVRPAYVPIWFTRLVDVAVAIITLRWPSRVGNRRHERPPAGRNIQHVHSRILRIDSAKQRFHYVSLIIFMSCFPIYWRLFFALLSTFHLSSLLSTTVCNCVQAYKRTCRFLCRDRGKKILGKLLAIKERG